MKFHKQTIKHDPIARTTGDCYRVTIASLLDLEPEDVPHFYEDAMDNMPNSADATEEWIDNWLLERGVIRIRAVIVDVGQTFDEMLQVLALFSPTGYPAILSGQTRHGSNHCIIVRDGYAIHDPSIGDDLLARPFPPRDGSTDPGAWTIEWLANPLSSMWEKN